MKDIQFLETLIDSLSPYPLTPMLSYGYCNSCPKFQTLFDEYHSSIALYASDFLHSINERGYIVGNLFIFNRTVSLTRYTPIQIRLLFIEYLKETYIYLKSIQ
jgi:hypothetical protein